MMWTPPNLAPPYVVEIQDASQSQLPRLSPAHAPTAAGVKLARVCLRQRRRGQAPRTRTRRPESERDSGTRRRGGGGDEGVEQQQFLPSAARAPPRDRR
jgi:hypothetical protein